MGVDHEILDSGCCGMAGSFGFSADHYEVSTRVGERVLLPAVRRLGPDEVILTDGFSCREQITQSTDRRPLHLAELVQQAIASSDEPSSPRRAPGATAGFTGGGGSRAPCGGRSPARARIDRSRPDSSVGHEGPTISRSASPNVEATAQSAAAAPRHRPPRTTTTTAVAA